MSDAVAATALHLSDNRFHRHCQVCSGTAGRPAGCPCMEPSTEYQRFAQECRRLAQQAKTEEHRRMLEEMAQAWEKLVKETNQKGSRSPP